MYNARNLIYTQALSPRSIRYRVANVKQIFQFKPEFDDGKEVLCLGGKKDFKELDKD